MNGFLSRLCQSGSQTRKLFLVSTHLLFTTYIIRNQQSVTFIITYEDDF